MSDCWIDDEIVVRRITLGLDCDDKFVQGQYFFTHRHKSPFRFSTVDGPGAIVCCQIRELFPIKPNFGISRSGFEIGDFVFEIFFVIKLVNRSAGVRGFADLLRRFGLRAAWLSSGSRLIFYFAMH